MKQTTQTTGDQKTTRAWLNKYGEYNLNAALRALLKYLANMCYWQETGKSYKVRRDFEVSLPTLKKNMFCDSLTTAQRYIAEAESMGFISIIRSETGGRNAYALHIDKSEHYEGGTKAFKPSKTVKQERDRFKREAKTVYERKRREELIKQAAAEDPYEDLVAWAGLDRGPRE
jgi:hypothetical protein